MKSQVHEYETSMRCAEAKYDRQFERENGDEVVNLLVAKDMIPQAIALHRHITTIVSERKEYLGNNTEQLGVLMLNWKRLTSRVFSITVCPL